MIYKWAISFFCYIYCDMKKCRYIELFAGVGGFHVGLDKSDKDFYKCVMANQWEPGTKDQFAANIYRKRFPNDLLINDDICKVSGKDIDCDMLTGGFCCLGANTRILTNDGYKFIVDVKEGDMVLSHDNQYHKVNKLMYQGIQQTYKIVGSGFIDMYATGNHKFFVREKHYKFKVDENKKACRYRIFNKPEWKTVDEFKDNCKKFYVGTAINQNSVVPIWKGVDVYTGFQTKRTLCSLDMYDENLWYIIGRFLGDGWIIKQNKLGDLRYKYKGIGICCGKTEYDDLKKKISSRYRYTFSKNVTVYNLLFHNVELAAFCEQFYSSNHNAHTKRIPGFVYDLPVNLLKSLLDGYQDSDGCITGIYNQFSSVSEELLYGIAHCIEKVYHKPTLIFKNNVPNKKIIDGRLVNQSPFYTLRYRCNESVHHTYFYEDGYIWYPITKVEESVEQPVYDIEVDESHSFIANHCIVHNCQDYSIVCNKSKSMGIEGEKGVLWWEVVRLITEMRLKPKYLLLENVDRMLISPSKQRGRDFALILQSLINLGYNIEWRVINATDYGMPQKRKRVFMFGFLKDEFKVDNPTDWLYEDGILAKAFPIKKTDIGLWELDGKVLDNNLVSLSNNFNKKNIENHPFENGGVVIDGKIYTDKLIPDYNGPYTTLGDILVKGDDRVLITSEYYIKDEDIKKWEYVKGHKEFKRISKDGYEYTYSEGSMAFPDYLDRPARTLITSEVSNTPNRFTHIIKDPENGRLRRLIPLELERIQMFPDNHTEGITDKKRGFLMGNALVCGIVERIGNELKKRIYDRM